MDLVDPLLINTIAENREVILFENAGVGHSEGTVQDTLEAACSTVVDFLTSIGVSKVDILGFSLGGMIAQYIVVSHACLVNKLILAGTQSSYTEGVIFGGPEIMEIAGGAAPSEEDMMKLFFYPSSTSRALGHAWFERTKERQVEGEQWRGFLNQAGAAKQQAAIGKFAADTELLEKLKQVDTPVLVTNGKADIMTPTSNSYILLQQLRNAQLHLYPDAGHGHLYQVPEIYAKQVELFLSA
jgi:pimeloyl-ACP methyl ester carboxylesterase